MAMANARIVTPMSCHAVMVPFAIVTKNSENQETLRMAGSLCVLQNVLSAHISAIFPRF